MMSPTLKAIDAVRNYPNSTHKELAGVFGVTDRTIRSARYLEWRAPEYLTHLENGGSIQRGRYTAKSANSVAGYIKNNIEEFGVFDRFHGLSMSPTQETI